MSETKTCFQLLQGFSFLQSKKGNHIYEKQQFILLYKVVIPQTIEQIKFLI